MEKNLLFLGFFFSNSELSIGVRVIAAAKETAITMVTIQPNCLKSTPAIPVRKVNGKNTAIITKVEAIMERDTSLVANTAAALGFDPRSICVVMFSNTTMESSTTKPMAMDMDDNEMIFNVLPVANR